MLLFLRWKFLEIFVSVYSVNIDHYMCINSVSYTTFAHDHLPTSIKGVNFYRLISLNCCFRLLQGTSAESSKKSFVNNTLVFYYYISWPHIHTYIQVYMHAYMRTCCKTLGHYLYTETCYYWLWVLVFKFENMMTFFSPQILIPDILNIPLLHQIQIAVSI